mgnify:FL=1
MAYGKKLFFFFSGYMIACFFIFLAIVYLAFNMLDGWRKYKESTKRLESSTASLVELNSQYEELKKTEALERSTTGYEMHVRSKFDLNRPDEKVVFIVSEDVPEEVLQEKGIQKIIHTFKNFFS